MMKIWIVRGGTGEGHDRKEWTVAAFTKEESAKKRAGQATRRAGEIYREREKMRWIGTMPNNEYDPEMEVDYTGTDYEVEETELQSTDEEGGKDE